MKAADEVGRAASLTSGVLALEDHLHASQDPVLNRDRVLGSHEEEMTLRQGLLRTLQSYKRLGWV